MAETEIDEINQQVTAALAAAIQAAGQLADAAVRVYAASLRRAAERDEAIAQRERARVLEAQTAARTIFSQVDRPGWWRHATVEDIQTAWQAAAVWHKVDPRAATARQTLRENLRDRGIVPDESRMDAGDVAWLTAAWQLAATETAQPATPEQRENSAEKATERGQDQTGRQTPTAADAARMETLLRKHLPESSAGTLVECHAWPALARRLHEAECAGIDMPALFRRLPNIDQGKTPAALAAWLVQRETKLHLDRQPKGQSPTPTRSVQQQGSAQRAESPKESRPAGARPAASLVAVTHPTPTTTAVAQTSQEAANPGAVPLTLRRVRHRMTEATVDRSR